MDKRGGGVKVVTPLKTNFKVLKCMNLLPYPIPITNLSLKLSFPLREKKFNGVITDDGRTDLP